MLEHKKELRRHGNLIYGYEEGWAKWIKIRDEKTGGRKKKSWYHDEAQKPFGSYSRKISGSKYSRKTFCLSERRLKTWRIVHWSTGLRPLSNEHNELA